MPGYAIHVAIAKEYIKKHKTEINNREEFLKGTVAPDFYKNKSISHYGNWENYQTDIYLDKFLSDKKVDIDSDYWKGYFLHLYTDKMFANEYFYEELLEIKANNDNFHSDYDMLNQIVIDEYGIDKQNFLKLVNKELAFTNGNTKYLKYSKIKKMIEEISNKSIYDEIKKVKKEGSI